MTGTCSRLWRPSALGFVQAALRRRFWAPYDYGCFDQELVNDHLRMGADGFRWECFPLVLRGGSSGVRVRFLNYTRWPRSFRSKNSRFGTANRSRWLKYRPNKEGACLYHPFLGKKAVATAYLEEYSRWGLWYL